MHACLSVGGRCYICEVLPDGMVLLLVALHSCIVVGLFRSENRKKDMKNMSLFDLAYMPINPDSSQIVNTTTSGSSQQLI